MSTLTRVTFRVTNLLTVCRLTGTGDVSNVTVTLERVLPPPFVLAEEVERTVREHTGEHCTAEELAQTLADELHAHVVVSQQGGHGVEAEARP